MSVAGSPRRSCRRGRGSPRGWRRCCRCCICTACPRCDFGPALEQFLGSAAGLSAATITRLTAQWQDDAEAFNSGRWPASDYVYVWVDGIHLKVRLEQDKVCLLVIIGVRADGRKELVALADGFRESAESWADLLRVRVAAWPPRCSPSVTVRSGSGRASVTCSPRPASSGAGST